MDRGLLYLVFGVDVGDMSTLLFWRGVYLAGITVLRTRNDDFFCFCVCWFISI